MKGLVSLDTTKVSLATQDSPRLVTNINEDVASA